jgi:hypothetical protein
MTVATAFPAKLVNARASDMNRSSLFFDHRDPDQVGRLGTARLDI